MSIAVLVVASLVPDAVLWFHFRGVDEWKLVIAEFTLSPRYHPYQLLLSRSISGSDAFLPYIKRSTWQRIHCMKKHLLRS